MKKTKKSKKLKVIICIVAVVILYAVTCVVAQQVKLKQMNNQVAASTNIQLGQDRRTELESRDIQLDYTVYSKEEITEENHKSDAVISWFPADKKKSNRYVIICPGGAYETCSDDIEGATPAAVLNQLGFTAFVLNYRVAEHGGNYAAIEDLARAVSFISENEKLFDVDADDYALLGFSAGGNLIGLFASEDMGYSKYNVQKPGCLIMGYPWSNMNIKTWNAANAIMYTILDNKGYKGLIGEDATKEQKQQMCVPGHITENYPPTYIMHGKADSIVPIKTHSDVLVKALKVNGVNVVYEQAEGVNHGVGIAEGTDAEGWLERAINFWESL